jgi:hypothetical protein
MDPFQFSESQWVSISAELGRTGRKKNDGDRQNLEMICSHFRQLRPKLKRNTPAPVKAQAAWHKVAAAARTLESAIEGLPAAGAADFTFLDAHKKIGGWRDWSEKLKSLKDAADCAAELELAGARAVSNNADPMRDAFVKQLMAMWPGRISHGDQGPLVGFLSAVMATVEPMTTDQLRWCVRRISES